MSLYELDDVSKTYRQGANDVHALRHVSLRIEPGERIAVQGSTGGGKSTLLQILGLLDDPTSGRVRLDGTEVASLSESDRAGLRAEKIGFVFQNYNLIPTLTAAENVLTGLIPLGWPAGRRREAVRDVLAAVGLSDRAEHLPAALSGGQQQRVAIARALVKRPAVLLADEPTGNLDEETRDEIVDMIERVCTDNHLTLVMVTHDSVLAGRAQRRLQIKSGRLSER